MAIVFALISAFGYGLANSIASIATKKIGVTLSVIFRSVFTFLLIFLTWLFFGAEANFNFQTINFALLVSFLGYIGLYFLYKALDTGKVGLVTPIFSIHPVFTIFIAILFFNQNLTWQRFFWILVTISSTFFLTFDFKDLKDSKIFKLNSGFFYALITALFFGIAFSLWGLLATSIGALAAAMIIEFGNIIFASAQFFIENFDQKKPNSNFCWQVWITLVITSIGTTLGSIFQILALTRGNLTQIPPVLGSSVLFSIFFGRLLFNEKLFLKEYLLILVIFLGIAFLSLS